MGATLSNINRQYLSSAGTLAVSQQDEPALSCPYPSPPKVSMPPQSVLPETTAVGLTKEALEVLNAKAMDGKAMAAAEVCACCGISVSLHHALIASCIPMGRNNMCSTEKKGSITMTAWCCLAGTGHAKKGWFYFPILDCVF